MLWASGCKSLMVSQGCTHCGDSQVVVVGVVVGVGVVEGEGGSEGVVEGEVEGWV